MKKKLEKVILDYNDDNFMVDLYNYEQDDKLFVTNLNKKIVESLIYKFNDNEWLLARMIQSLFSVDVYFIDEDKVKIMNGDYTVLGFYSNNFEGTYNANDPYHSIRLMDSENFELTYMHEVAHMFSAIEYGFKEVFRTFEDDETEEDMGNIHKDEDDHGERWKKWYKKITNLNKFSYPAKYDMNGYETKEMI